MTADYITVAREATAEFTEKRSRFIGAVRPVQSEEEAAAFVAEKRAKHWNAAHNVYAYALRAGQICRYSDDGEPQGTAGIPALQTVQGARVTDAVVVVTRYFGGVLLGTGGLARAYAKGAKVALEAAGLIYMRRRLVVSLTCDYAQYGRIGAMIPALGGVQKNADFGAAVTLEFLLPPGERSAFEEQLADATAGTVTAAFMGDTSIAVPITQEGESSPKL